MSTQKEYWNKVADTKEFTTPMQSAVFCRYVNRDAAILDVGCGYGRILNELHSLGFRNLCGIDNAASASFRFWTCGFSRRIPLIFPMRHSMRSCSVPS